MACRPSGQLADFVEEQRAPIRDLELAQLALRGAGERAALVAEELGFEQRIGNGGAVDGDKRPVRARAQRVQRARKQFLAGAALAFEQHRRVGAGRALDLLRHVPHHGGFADDRRRAATLGELLLEQRVFRDQPPLRERPLDHQQQMVGIDRLGQEVERALLHRRDRILDAAERGHDNHRQFRIDVFRGLQDAEAVADREPKIGQDDRRCALLESLDGFSLIAGLDDLMALRLERVPQHRTERVFVLDEEDRGVRHVSVLKLRTQL